MVVSTKSNKITNGIFKDWDISVTVGGVQGKTTYKVAKENVNFVITKDTKVSALTQEDLAVACADALAADAVALMFAYTDHLQNGMGKPTAITKFTAEVAKELNTIPDAFFNNKNNIQQVYSRIKVYGNAAITGQPIVSKHLSAEERAPFIELSEAYRNRFDAHIGDVKARANDESATLDKFDKIFS